MRRYSLFLSRSREQESFEMDNDVPFLIGTLVSLLCVTKF